LGALNTLLEEAVKLAPQRNSWGSVLKFLSSEKIEEFGKEINVNPSTVITIALHVVEEVQRSHWLREDTCMDPSSIAITEEQEEILQYITGAILRKLRLRYNRQRNMNLVDELEGLIDNENEKRYKLIHLKNRGGLISPVEDLLPLIYSGYKIFKAGLRSCAVCIQEVLHSARVDETLLGCVDVTVLKNILQVLHKTLSHHECDLYMEKMKIKKKCTGKGKGLRTKLADKNTL
jgi:hypothetical protein